VTSTGQRKNSRPKAKLCAAPDHSFADLVLDASVDDEILPQRRPARILGQWDEQSLDGNGLPR
jgi:hypothetical protein